MLCAWNVLVISVVIYILFTALQIAHIILRYVKVVIFFLSVKNWIPVRYFPLKRWQKSTMWQVPKERGINIAVNGPLLVRNLHQEPVINSYVDTTH